MPESPRRPDSSGANLAEPPAHGASIAALLLIGFALLIPLPWIAPQLPAAFGFALPLDKLAHFALFFAAAKPWRGSLARWGSARPGTATVGFASAYAGILELAQQGLTGGERRGELADLVAGALGALAGVILWSVASGRRKNVDASPAQPPIAVPERGGTVEPW